MFCRDLGFENPVFTELDDLQLITTVPEGSDAGATSACCLHCRLSLLSHCFASLLAFARLVVYLVECLLAAAAADSWSAAGGTGR